MAIAYRSSNPVLNNKFMAALTGVETMSLQGSLRKIGFLLTLTIISSFATALVCLTAGENMFLYAGIFSTVGAVLGFILAMITFVTRPQNPVALMSLYAIFEGLFVGGMSLVMEAYYPGIVLQAAFGTVCITGTMYAMYASRIIRPTPMFNKVIGGLVISICFLYMTSFVLSMFSGYDVPFLHSSGPIGIGLTLFILVVASLTLISDFGFIEAGVKNGAPKNMEWYAAFGILISLIWIYIETLRLLSKLRTFMQD
ncbi:Bax inhibitor-1/YccA family protein [Candidatus Poseidonia alphae]|nr:Bax inhibitor-1/YccA family protein [Candidatus Poseidonia alphae]MDA8748652.1 Bax inhibitor-1/YccA family protein [Candidatus Poseidonia alphae]